MKFKKYIIYQDLIRPALFWTGSGWSPEKRRAKVMPHFEASQKVTRMLRDATDGRHAKTLPFTGYENIGYNKTTGKVHTK